MTFVLASDIHANLPAMESFYTFLKVQGLDSFPRYFLGDYVNLGPHPRETINLLSSDKAALFIRGNHDRYIIDESLLHYNPYFKTPEGMEHARWTHAQLTSDNKTWLSTLKSAIKFNVAGWNIVLIHGSPESDEEPFFPGNPAIPTLYLCGHTHVPRDETINGSRVLNPGSLGKPLDGDNRASFALVRLGSGFVEYENIRIPYNIEQTISALEERKVPWRKGMIESIRTAAYSNE